MGKNVMGGGKSRKGARNRQGDSATQKATRHAKEEGEVYACVTRMFGGPNCEVKCIDGKLRLCVIRNKFRGRGKRDNTLTTGVWVLIGVRDWESPPEGKLPKCDLLEVYSSADKQRLKNSDKALNWAALAGIGQDVDAVSDDEVDFVDGDTAHYEQVMESNGSRIGFMDSSAVDDPLNIDDI